MILFKKTRKQIVFLFGMLSISTALFANQAEINSENLSNNLTFFNFLQNKLKSGHAILQLGGYWSVAGSKQHINIQDLIGNEFTVTNKDDSNGLVGLGYFIDPVEMVKFNLSFGVNAFYLAKAGVSGNIIQENLFTNLSYHYYLTNYPVYAVAKSIIKTSSSKYNAILDVGIGPNFMQAQGFKESTLSSNTLPDVIFSSHTTTTFTATVGAGLRINKIIGQAPLECGYRFFYLGQGNFTTINSQVNNSLKTGQVYGNAVMCSIIV